jgi:hypothetical protein
MQRPHATCVRCIEPELGDCHPQCLSLALSLADNVVYAALLKAAAQGNVDAVMRYAARVPELVRFHTTRRSIQILSACSPGQLSANVALSTSAQVNLAMALLPHSGPTLGPRRVANVASR